MKNPLHLSDESLEFIIRDCLAAISANPENPKSEEYLATVRAYRKEQIARTAKRIDRGLLREFSPGDRLLVPFAKRGRIRPRALWETGALVTAWHNLYFERALEASLPVRIRRLARALARSGL